jgi:hypothetical protein
MDPEVLAPIEQGTGSIIQSKVEDVVVISVSPTLSMSAVQGLAKRAQEVFGKEAVVVTHNVEFLKVQEVRK